MIFNSIINFSYDLSDTQFPIRNPTDQKVNQNRHHNIENIVKQADSSPSANRGQIEQLTEDNINPVNYKIDDKEKNYRNYPTEFCIEQNGSCKDDSQKSYNHDIHPCNQTEKAHPKYQPPVYLNINASLKEFSYRPEKFSKTSIAGCCNSQSSSSGYKESHEHKCHLQ